MKELANLSWSSTLIGAASVASTAAIIVGRPRDPTFQVITISLSSFKLNFPLLDAELILTVQVTNPNIVPIYYSSSTMSIFYDGSLLGSALVEAGSQPAKSFRILTLPARLNGIKLASHAAKFLSDVVGRKMTLDATVDIEGEAKVLWWSHKFKVHVDSHIVVDPVFLDVIEQENKSKLELFLT